MVPDTITDMSEVVEETKRSDADQPDTYDVALLKAFHRAGVSIATAVPESMLKDLYFGLAADPSITYVPAASEADMPGIAVGAYLGGKRAVMIMENSGIRQACEPIARFAFSHHAPFVMLLALRGTLGERNWWGHNHSQTMYPILEALRIPSWTIDRLADLDDSIDKAFVHAGSSQWPVALVLTGECVGRDAR